MPKQPISSGNFMKIPNMDSAMKLNYLQNVAGDNMWKFTGVGDCKMYFNQKGRWILCVQYYGAKKTSTRMFIPKRYADKWEEVLKRQPIESEESNVILQD